jgi:hypothetical protein
MLLTKHLKQGHIYFGSPRAQDENSDDLLLSSQPEMQQQTFNMLHRFGPYMYGMGFMLSSSVVNFLGTASIPPKQTWCEDVMVGMWLLPYEVTWLDANKHGFPILDRRQAIPMARSGHAVLLTHYMQNQDWETISEDGVIVFTSHDESFYFKVSHALSSGVL